MVHGRSYLVSLILLIGGCVAPRTSLERPLLGETVQPALPSQVTTTELLPLSELEPTAESDRPEGMNQIVERSTTNSGNGDPHEDSVRLDPADSPVLELNDVIAQSYRVNPDLFQLVARIEEADGAIAEAAADFGPTVGLTQDYGISNNPIQSFSYLLNQRQPVLPGSSATVDNFHTQLRVQQGIYQGGVRRARQEGAKVQYNAACYDLQSLRNQLAFRVAQAYYRLLQGRDLINVRAEAVAQVERHLHEVESRMRTGTAVMSDRLSVLVRKAEAREALISARNDFELAWALLENVVGSKVTRCPLPDQIPAAPWDTQVEAIQAAVREGISARPELEAHRQRQSSAKSQIQEALGGKRAQIHFISDYDLFSGDLSQVNDSFFVGVVASINAYDGGRTSARVSQAQSRWRQLQAESARIAQDIELDVQRAWLGLRSAEERFQVTQEAVEQARESLRLIEVEYEGGVSTITQLLDAQVALSSVRVRQTNAQADIEIARSDLARALGRLTDVVSHQP